jgi:hypothetical protein
MNPAKIVKGIVAMYIFKPFLKPVLKEFSLENVLGNKILPPSIKPAKASTTIPVISIAPCSHIPLKLSMNTFS